jgi:hypothetical protein
MLLVLVSIASLIGSLVYFTLRFLEFKSPFKSIAINWFVFTCPLLIATIKIPTNEIISVYVSMLLFGLLGIIFHRNASGTHTNFITAFGLMAATALYTAFLTILTYALDFSNPSPWSLSKSWTLLTSTYYEHSIYIVIMAQSMTTPFLIWVWKSRHLRPGIDKHLKS